MASHRLDTNKQYLLSQEINKKDSNLFVYNQPCLHASLVDKAESEVPRFSESDEIGYLKRLLHMNKQRT